MGNNTFNTFSPFLASNLVQVKPFRFHNKNVENFASRMCSIAKERHRAITEKMSMAAFPESKADTMALDISMQNVYKAIHEKRLKSVALFEELSPEEREEWQNKVKEKTFMRL